MCSTVTQVVYSFNHTKVFTSVSATTIMLSVIPSAVKNAVFIYTPLELPQALTCIVCTVYV
jgi:hypothetical protein